MLNDSPLRTAPGVADDTATLLLRCGNGDRAAFRTLYDRWSGRLHGIALRITRQAPLAADATHDAFVQVWQQAHRFDPARGNAEAFLVSLVRYRALDIVRRRGREISGYEPGSAPTKRPMHWRNWSAAPRAKRCTAVSACSTQNAAASSSWRLLKDCRTANWPTNSVCRWAPSSRGSVVACCRCGSALRHERRIGS